MSAAEGTLDTASQPGLLSKERTIAGAGYNRWLVPPAALAIHLCIGMAYGFSVFWLPLSKSLSGAAACSRGTGFWGGIAAGLAEFTATDCNWNISTLGWMFTLFFVFLG